MAYKHHAGSNKDMRVFSLGAVGPLASRAVLSGHLGHLDAEERLSLGELRGSLL